VITLSGAKIPEVLRQIPNSPKQLSVEGELGELLKRSRVAIVDSRKVSPYGRDVTTNN